MTRLCRTCAAPITRYSKTGLCRACVRTDPDVSARKSAKVRLKYQSDPSYRENQRARTAEHNRSAKMRKLAGEKARAMRIWEKGLACMTPELRKQAGRTLSAVKLAHIPPELRDEYRALTRRRWYKDEATAMIMEMHDKQMQRFLRKLEAATQ